MYNIYRQYEGLRNKWVTVTSWYKNRRCVVKYIHLQDKRKTLKKHPRLLMLAWPGRAATSPDSPPPRPRSWSTDRRPVSCSHPRRTSGFGLTWASSFRGYTKVQKYKLSLPLIKMMVIDAKSSSGKTSAFFLKRNNFFFASFSQT